MMKMVLKKLIFKKYIAAFIYVMLYTTLSMAETDEFVAHIADVDIETAKVTLVAKDINNVDYRLAYDVRIRLANGAKGAVANLRKGNQITAVGDVDTKVIYVINVLN